MSEKMTKVVSGNTVKHKKTLGETFRETFIEDDMNTVREHIASDVIVPAIKDLVHDIIVNGIESLLYGGTRKPIRRGSSTSYGNAVYTNYNSISRDSKPAAVSRSSAVVEAVVLEDKGEAEVVLDNLLEAIDRYNFTTVGDLYDLVGRETTQTDYKYGWDNLSTASVIRVREGYLIKLPKPHAIN